MERVIFLDRDGTLNEEVNYLHRKEDLVLLPGVAEALGELKRAGYRLVVVTNQAVSEAFILAKKAGVNPEGILRGG